MQTYYTLALRIASEFFAFQHASAPAQFKPVVVTQSCHRVRAGCCNSILMTQSLQNLPGMLSTSWAAPSAGQLLRPGQKLNFIPFYRKSRNEKLCDAIYDEGRPDEVPSSLLKSNGFPQSCERPMNSSQYYGYYGHIKDGHGILCTRTSW